MADYNDATKQFWQNLVGRNTGFTEIKNDDDLRIALEVDSVPGPIFMPSSAENVSFSRASASVFQPVSPPSGFTWISSPLSNKLYVDQFGNFTTTLDVASLKSSGGTVRYVSTTGSNSNDGSTEALAFRSVSTALNASSSGDTIMVKAGEYLRNDVVPASINKSISIIGYGGPVIFSHSDSLVWTLTAGQTYTYQANRSAVGNVGDFATSTQGIRYKKLTSIAAVEATPGSFFSDIAIVYVHAIDNRVVDSNIKAFLTTSMFINNGDFTTYLENIIFRGGQSVVDIRSTAGGTGPVLYMKKCEVSYSTAQNGLNALGTSLSVLQECDAYNNFLDGFNYHIFNGVVPKAIEIDCRGFSNGGGSLSDNGSTSHDGSKLIRVNGSYYDNNGANVIDVNAGTQSWNLGCVAKNSKQFRDFSTNTGLAQMWLDSCQASGSQYSVAADDGIINIRGGKFERRYTNNGVINAY